MQEFSSKYPNGLSVRAAVYHDLPKILILMDQLGYPQDLNELEERFKNFITKDGYGVAIAEKDQSIVGWVAWSKSLLFVSSKVRIHIEGIVVDTQYRGEKVGQALMAHVEELAQQFSPCIIDLTSGLRRAKEGTHEFYKSLGYHNEGQMAKLYLRKEIG